MLRVGLVPCLHVCTLWTLCSHMSSCFLRLVNGLVEKTRKKTEVSIAAAADAIGIPRVLIDIRHGEHL